MSEKCDHLVGWVEYYTGTELVPTSKVPELSREPDVMFKHCPECGERLEPVDKDVEFLLTRARLPWVPGISERYLRIAERLEKERR